MHTTELNLLTNRITNQFKAIGNHDGTEMPRTTRNTETVAWEYHVASHLKRIAEARQKEAQKECVKHGLMFDHEQEPLPAGTNATVYSGDVVTISVSTKAGASRIDHTAFTAALIKAGVDKALVERLSYEHTKLSRAAHTFTTSLITNGENSG